MKARFQFFYSFHFERDKAALCGDGFDPHVPTRDVLNSHKAGHKTEPFLERHIENWCPCRPRQIKAAVKEAIAMPPNENHYLILTTTHPAAKNHLAVGYLQFDARRYRNLRKLLRFADREAVYPGCVEQSHLVSFEDAYQFEDIFTPGARYGFQKAKAGQGEAIIEHLRSKENRISSFLSNVRILETRLKRLHPEAYANYTSKLSSRSSRCGRTPKSS